MNTPVRHYLALHFAGCILIAMVGVELGTDLFYNFYKFIRYGYEDNLYREVGLLEILILTSALITSILTAFLLRPKAAPQRIHFIRHFALMTAILAASHLLWVQPIWGFHHDITLGVFAWIFLGGEDGFFIFPNIIGLGLTVISYWVLILSVWVSRSVPATGT